LSLTPRQQAANELAISLGHNPIYIDKPVPVSIAPTVTPITDAAVPGNEKNDASGAARELKFDPLPAVPAIFKQISAWVTYKSAEDKAPIKSGTFENAKSSDPKTQVDYATAVANVQAGRGYANLGFVTDGARTANLTGIDIDGCRTDTGITAKARAILDFFKTNSISTYVEWTPNLGLRVWFRGDSSKYAQRKFTMYLEPGYKGKAQKVEVFQDGLYFTLTGNKLTGASNEVATLSAEQVDQLYVLLSGLEVAEVQKLRKHKRLVPQVVDGHTTFVEAPPDPAFKSLFDAVGWKPLEYRMSKMTDARFHGLTITDDASIFCPMPGHQPRGVDIPYTNVMFGEFNTNEGDSLVHCFGCGFTGDLVSTVKAFDAGEDGGKIEYATMYDCGRAICKEQGLDPDKFFPRAKTVAEAVEAVKQADVQLQTQPPQLQSNEINNQTEIPEFDDSVITGFFRQVVDAATEGTTIPRQFAFLAAKVYVGARLSTKMKFEGVDGDSSYYGTPIGLTGTSKGLAWRRTAEQILVSPARTKTSVKLFASVDSGAGLRDAFFDDPKDDPMILYIDEVTSLGHKAGDKKNPEILDGIIEFANSTTFSRVKSKKGKEKAAQTHTNAHLSLYMCGQDGEVFMSAFAGRTKLGLWDRFYPEFSNPVEADDLPNISSERIGAIWTALEKMSFTGEMVMTPETKAKVQAFWASQPAALRTKVRFKAYLMLDMYLTAWSEGRMTAQIEDLDAAIRIFTRQLVIRQKHFTGEIPDRIGHYLRLLKGIVKDMRDALNKGATPKQMALSLRDFQTDTNAFRDNELHVFKNAWNAWAKDYMVEVLTIGKNGQTYEKYLPKPTEDETWLPLPQDVKIGSKIVNIVVL
jgi:hypothetical protein